MRCVKMKIKIIIREKLKNTLLHDLIHRIRVNELKRKWRKLNVHNGTELISMVSPSLVQVGCASYGEINVVTFAQKNRLLIGNYVSVAEKVIFLLDVEHSLNHISTFPFKVKILQTMSSESFGKGDIVVDDDVWIGYGAIILSGVHIGQGAVVAAGAIVASNVPPYAIVGGVPAKVIRYRFDEDIIEELLNIDYSKLVKEDIEKHIDELYGIIDDKEQIAWFLKMLRNK